MKISNRLVGKVGKVGKLVLVVSWTNKFCVCFFVFHQLGLLGVRMSSKRYKQASRQATKSNPERPVQSLLAKAQHKYGSRLLVGAFSRHVRANAKKLGKACPNDHQPGRDDQDNQDDQDDQNGQNDQQTDLSGAHKVLISTRLLKEITRLIGFGSISSASLELRRLKVLQRIEGLIQSS